MEESFSPELPNKDLVYEALESCDIKKALKQIMRIGEHLGGPHAIITDETKEDKNQFLDTVMRYLRDNCDCVTNRTIVRNTYFKVPHGGPQLISGRPLPDPAGGPYKFVNCDFHPAVWRVLKEAYSDSAFEHCEGGPE